MKGKKLKIMSAVLSLSLLATYMTPVTINAATVSNESVMTFASEAEGARTNLKFLEGNPGDTHLVYTYEQEGNTYKAIEESTEDFRYVSARIYWLNENGDFVENSSQQLRINEEGNPEISITNANGETENRTIDVRSNVVKTVSSRSEWVTQYGNGSRGNLKGLAYSTLVAVVAAIATYYTAGALSSAVVAGVSTIASGLFNQNTNTVYYYAIYNWRHSPKNYLVIDETEWTEFYLDSGHNYSLGHTYAEYIF